MMKNSQSPIFNLFATTPKGLELLLVDELRELGAIEPREKLAGVSFSGDLQVAYKACLWSRLANRILLKLTDVPANTPEELYSGVRSVLWSEHIDAHASLAVHVISNQSTITHTLFAAQKVKDAIVDQFRENFGVRPSVKTDEPDVSIHVYLYRNVASISIDLSGESLHRRGYRTEQGKAPLKENLAAAILLRAGWKDIAKQGGMLLDSMCGSATFLVEAALMACDIAPGLLRDYFGFLGWKKHMPALWRSCYDEAINRRAENANTPTIVGYDTDAAAIKIAWANIKRAELSDKIHVERKDLQACAPKKDVTTGLFIVNPPYGERMGEIAELQALYADLGKKLKHDFVGWKAAVFTGNPELAKKIGIRVPRSYALFNGALPCRLLLFDVISEAFIDRGPAANNERRIKHAQKFLTEENRESVQMFKNRLLKKFKHLKKQAIANKLSCYRIYDADLPEYAVTIDRHGEYILVKEYPAPRSINPEKARERLQCIFAVLPEVLEIPSANIFSDEDGAEFNEKHPVIHCKIG